MLASKFRLFYIYVTSDLRKLSQTPLIIHSFNQTSWLLTLRCGYQYTIDLSQCVSTSCLTYISVLSNTIHSSQRPPRNSAAWQASFIILSHMPHRDINRCHPYCFLILGLGGPPWVSADYLSSMGSMNLDISFWASMRCFQHQCAVSNMLFTWWAVLSPDGLCDPRWANLGFGVLFPASIAVSHNYIRY